MIQLIRTEIAKLGGSLALLFALVVPALTSCLALLTIVVNERQSSWEMILGGFTLPLWVLFIFPMATATFATLCAQIEYRAKAWDHLLALPYPRWQLFAAKAIVVQGALMLMTVLLFVYTYGLISLAGWIIGEMPSGNPQVARIADSSVRFLAAGLLLTVIQLWVALRFANFVIPLAVGIAGTLVGLAVTMVGTEDADWFPWVLTLRASGEDWMQPVLIGLTGGIIAIGLMLLDLSRRAPR
ncbi:ABC transporter permease [Aurantiacibacter sp. D1-12]|uniref:ABC transporter permease n=1 Tax=Aurantiacibacter sp. D1-12 TaxID=2993658 RepID=UPI00237CE363|nr:ABC transporter permease [Aurantiacibacter sp. D1-12]MDE1467027.1 ABC transporter permease [Aurantiacibacter sp. D1-12]